MSPVPPFDQPLKLAPRLDAKQWGGRKLTLLGKQLPDGPIGESLESGNDARVIHGPWAGWTLGELARAHPDALLGPRGRAAAGAALDFPLLVKFIDAAEHLSVQVHPDDDQAPAGKRGKCEAWLILAAEPGAEIITGLRESTAPAGIAERLTRRVVAPGEVYMVAPGVVHAIGGGVMLYEIQQPSDVTYRLHDWGRDRELHIEQARAIAAVERRATQLRPRHVGPGRELLVTCRYFAVERRTLGAGTLEALPASCRVLTVLDGAIEVGDAALAAGESAVLPAAMPPRATRGRATALLACVPEPGHDDREPRAGAKRQEDSGALSRAR